MKDLQTYNRLWEETKGNYSDPRTVDLFMMNSPIPSALICLGYVVILPIGKQIMNNRPAFNIRNLLIIYNFAMVIFSAYLFYEFLASGWFNGYTLGCQLVDYSRSENAMRMVRACHLFFLSKFIELLDTVFFILKKNFRQVTFLHVFHHGIMPISWWFGVRFVPGGFGTFHACVNSFIHFLMYLYYGLAALGPAYQKFLFWKKSMTWMQMIQFMLVVIHSSQLFFVDCEYPILFAYWILIYAVIFLLLFANFYLQTYRKNSKDKIQGKKRE